MARVRTNPAFRLSALLQSVEKMDGQDTASALSAAFGLKQPTTAELFAAFGKLLTLVDLVGDCIEKMDPAVAENHRFSLIPIREALGLTHITGKWFQHKQLTSAERAMLRITAEALTQVVPEEEIMEEELQQVRTSLYHLRKQIGDADIDPSFKASLLSVLTRIINATIDYRWAGAEGIRRAAAEGFGQCVVHKNEFLKQKEAPWVTAYFTAMSRLSDLATVALLGHQLGLEAADLVTRLLQNS